MTKDKVIGAIIMILAIALIFFYTIIGPIDLLIESLGSENVQWLEVATGWFRNIPGMNWKWALVLPMWLVVFLIGIIAAWIGFSMLTTPPPVPLEELEEELEAEESEAEEKSSD